MVEHLLELGTGDRLRRRPRAHYEHVQARLAVWRDDAGAAGVEPGPVAYAPQLSSGVTAIVTTSDVLATALLAEARERGIDVPGALSLTGFDDSPLAALGSPSLTSVRIDYAGFGASAAAQLLAAIAGEPPPLYEPAAPELVMRESTGRSRELGVDHPDVRLPVGAEVGSRSTVDRRQAVREHVRAGLRERQAGPASPTRRRCR